MVDFRCPNCPGLFLMSKGVYNHVRLVLDLRDFIIADASFLILF